MQISWSFSILALPVPGPIIRCVEVGGLGGVTNLCSFTDRGSRRIRADLGLGASPGWAGASGNRSRNPKCERWRSWWAKLSLNWGTRCASADAWLGSASAPPPPVALRLGVGETPSPVGTRIWQREGAGSQLLLVTASLPSGPARTRAPPPRRQVRGCFSPQPLVALLCPQAPSAWDRSRANFRRHEGCRFETPRLLLPLRAISVGGTFHSARL